MSYETDRETLVFPDNEIGHEMRAYDQSWLKLKYLTDFYNEMVRIGNTRKMGDLDPKYFDGKDLLFPLYGGDFVKLHNMIVTFEEAIEYFSTKPKSRKKLEYYIRDYMVVADLAFYDLERYSFIDGYLKITRFREVIDGRVVMVDTFEEEKRKVEGKYRE